MLKEITMALRKDANTLTSNERSELVNALLQLKEEGIYDQFVLRHANASMGSIHSCPAFLPWHRRYLWDLEQELQRVSGNPDLGIPYWNWSSGGSGASLWDEDLLGGDGDANGIVRTGPFRSGQWETVNSSGNSVGPLLRSFGQNTNGGLPTSAEIEQLLQVTPYDARPWNRRSNPSFRNLLEGWLGTTGPSFHNFGHVWVGGSMLPMTSPNDPVFFFHHCMVDKLWHDWQTSFPSQGYVPVSGGNFGQNLTDIMDSTPNASIGRRPLDVMDSNAIGIDYDGTVIPPPVLFESIDVDGASIDGSIGVAGEVNIYTFDVTAFGEYIIETSGSSDTFITLFGPNDPLDQIAFNDDGGDGLNSNITLNLSAGQYFLAVRLFSPRTTGNYSIEVSSSSPASSTIPELIVDAPATAAAISARSESDIFRFRVVRRANHTIETDGITDTYLSLHGPNDETLFIEEDDDSGRRLNSQIRRILRAGEYYARVRHFSPNGTGAYTIRVEKR